MRSTSESRLLANRHSTTIVLVLSTAALVLAWWLASMYLLYAGLIGFTFVGMRLGRDRLLAHSRLVRAWRQAVMGPGEIGTGGPGDRGTGGGSEFPVVPQSHDPNVPSFAPPPRDELESLVDEILRRERYALLVRPQLAERLAPRHVERGMLALQEAMALVPQGKVRLGSIEEGREIWVDAVYLDRFPVTNEQYQQFVDDGGYEQMELWATEIWPGILDFVDRSGAPGPRYWRDGRHQNGLARHPVVGICWYEAAAYARWAGKRLPTDAEWVKTGCWPMTLEDGSVIQREYPWGQSMDRGKARLWSAESFGPLAVDELRCGGSVGGVEQLIGNVWEWTSSNFGNPQLHLTNEAARPGHRARFKSLRGGAFDTYFESQATCHFQSGDESVARKHNVGFRCALSMCDVVGGSPPAVEEAGFEKSAAGALAPG